ncbi:MAG: hypothetical protein QNJ90_02260 [Planctomycetota bacterium]|nr:hypothetical protein [Planctomycetota bacterium]
MRLSVSFVLCALLLLTGCGEGDTPPAPEPQDRAPEKPVEQPKPPAEPTPVEPQPSSPPAEAPADHEDYIPPPNWCGTPGMMPGRRPTGGFDAKWVFLNDKGDVLRLPLSDVTLEKLEELRKKGWKVRLRTRPK